MIGSFAHRVVNVIELDQVSAAPAVVYTDRGTWHIEDPVVTDGIFFGDGEEDCRALFAEITAIMDEIIGDQVFGWQRTVGSLNLAFASYQANGAIAAARNAIAVDSGASVEIVDKYCVAAHLVEKAICYRAIFSALKKYCSTAMNCPVTECWRFIKIEECTRSVCNPEA